MTHKLVIITDPGIDGAFALTLALLDPDLDILGVGATAGNVSAEQATRNVHIVVEHVDPPRWPRLGAGLPAEYDTDCRKLHGPQGLGATDFPCAPLHHPHPSDKLITDLVRQNPKEVTVVVLGPLTALARALDRDIELAALVRRVICVGGVWHEPGDAGAAAEFHFYCDPPAARQVLHAGLPLTLIPLDVTRKVLFSPAHLRELTREESRACRFLGQVIPFGIGASSNLYGIEGFHLADVLGVVAAALPGVVSTTPMRVDVEVKGELTRGMSVVDTRPGRTTDPNVDLAVGVDLTSVRHYVEDTLKRARG